MPFVPLKEQQLTPQQLKKSLSIFMLKIHKLLNLLDLDLTPYQADHIALRINNYALAKLAHTAWLQQAHEWSNKQINGRPIIILGLNHALIACNWSIECLELPYPGEKEYPQQGWEHIEWVIPCEVASQEAFLAHILTTFPTLKEKWSSFDKLKIKVKQSSPSGNGELLVNYTVAFKYQGITIKFHPYPLKKIIASEKVIR